MIATRRSLLAAGRYRRPKLLVSPEKQGLVTFDFIAA
jgi:hypothetical protein